MECATPAGVLGSARSLLASLRLLSFHVSLAHFCLSSDYSLSLLFAVFACRYTCLPLFVPPRTCLQRCRWRPLTTGFVCLRLLVTTSCDFSHSLFVMSSSSLRTTRASSAAASLAASSAAAASVSSQHSSLPPHDDVAAEAEEAEKLSAGAGLLAEREAALLARSAALEEEMSLLRVADLERRVLAQEAMLRAARASSVSASVQAPVIGYASIPQAGSAYEATPARSGVRPMARELFDYIQTSSRSGSSRAAIAQRLSLQELPDVQDAAGVPDPALRLAPVLPDVPTVSRPSPLIRPVAPKKFSGEEEAANAKIEAWIEELNVYLALARVDPADHLAHARGFFTGDALTWLGQKREEVQSVGKVMTWPWLQTQLVLHYGRASGEAAMQAEWLALRMGTKNADGTESGGKSTRTVRAYTAEFVRLMRALAPRHGLQTTDLLIKDRYLQGIRIGYPGLYAVMLGNEKVLRYETLNDAIEGAQIAESDIAISKSVRHEPHGPGRNNNPRGFFNHRPHQAPEVSNLEGERGEGEKEEGETSSSAASSERRQLYGFVYRPNSTEGRHPLTETEALMLYKEHRCYRCYKAHKPLGRCTEPVQKVAPKALKA